MFDMQTATDFVLPQPDDPDDPNEVLTFLVHQQQVDTFRKIVGDCASRTNEKVPVPCVAFQMLAKDRDDAQDRLDAYEGQ